MDILPVNVPELLGLDFLDAEGLYADNWSIRLVHRKVYYHSSENFEFDDVRSAPITQQGGHFYCQMSFHVTTFYASAQMLKLHRQFTHPSLEKLYNPLRRAGLQAVTSKTLEQLK